MGPDREGGKDKAIHVCVCVFSSLCVGLKVPLILRGNISFRTIPTHSLLDE